MPTLTGGCLCGAVRYSATVDAVRSGLCHCLNCQKASGSAFSVNLFVPADRLAVTGALSQYKDTATASGRTVTRSFCPTCGASLMSETPAFANMVILKGGTLDDSTAVTPDTQVWTSTKQGWLQLDPAIRALPKGRT